MPPVDAESWIRKLDLQPHPEGGHYRETYRSTARTGSRNVCTAIYYLLREGERSRLHRLGSDELWHHYAGAPLTIHCLVPGKGYLPLLLGADDVDDARPQRIVPAGCWFGATCDEAGGFTLAGCTVAPGFEFADFEMAKRAELLRDFPDCRQWIERLTE